MCFWPKMNWLFAKNGEGSKARQKTLIYKFCQRNCHSFCCYYYCSRTMRISVFSSVLVVFVVYRYFTMFYCKNKNSFLNLLALLSITNNSVIFGVGVFTVFLFTLLVVVVFCLPYCCVRCVLSPFSLTVNWPPTKDRHQTS